MAEIEPDDKSGQELLPKAESGAGASDQRKKLLDDIVSCLQKPATLNFRQFFGGGSGRSLPGERCMTVPLTRLANSLPLLGAGRQRPSWPPQQGAISPKNGENGGEKWLKACLPADSQHLPWPSPNILVTPPDRSNLHSPVSCMGESVGQTSDCDISEVMEAAAVVGAAAAAVTVANGARPSCRFCQRAFPADSPEWRKRCEDAPDVCRDVIDVVSCSKAAECLAFHCISEEEDDADDGRHPCDCSHANGRRGVKHWSAMTCLSLFLPCICLYPPLMACWQGLAHFGLCGRRHQPL